MATGEVDVQKGSREGHRMDEGRGEDAAGSGLEKNSSPDEPLLIFDRSRAGRTGAALPAERDGEDPLARLPEAYRRGAAAELPEVSEPETVRHYTRLSQKNFSIDTNFYPLGSCTMKYNPRACEAAATLPGFTGLHPL